MEFYAFLSKLSLFQVDPKDGKGKCALFLEGIKTLSGVFKARDIY